MDQFIGAAVSSDLLADIMGSQDCCLPKQHTLDSFAHDRPISPGSDFLCLTPERSPSLDGIAPDLLSFNMDLGAAEHPEHRRSEMEFAYLDLDEPLDDLPMMSSGHDRSLDFDDLF